MTKIIKIGGMSCTHCSARIENALNSIKGVTASVDLEKGLAKINFENNISDEKLREAIEELGFDCLNISDLL